MTSEILRPEATATFTLPEPVMVDPPGRVIYQNNGALNWGPGWTTGYTANGSGATGVLLQAIGGRLWANTQASAFVPVNPTASFTVKRTLTDLQVGREYLVTAKLANFHASATRVRLSITATGDATEWVIGSTNMPVWMAFIATATTEELVVTLSDNPASSTTRDLVGLYMDDLAVTEQGLYKTVAELPVTQGKLTLDAGWSPFVQGELTVPLTDVNLLEQIDPRYQQRVVIVAQDPENGGYRESDLCIRKRTADLKAQTIALSLASDEALLQEKNSGLILPTQSARVYEASLRDLIGIWALPKIGAVLEPSPPGPIVDADLTAFWPLTNLFPNPASEHATEFVWEPASGAPTVTRSSSFAYQGTYSVRVQATASGDANVSGGKYSTTPGEWYTFQTHIRSSVSRNAQLLMRFYDANGRTVKNATSTLITTSSSTWQEREVIAQAPFNATEFEIFVLTDGNISGVFHYLDATLLYVGTGGEAYFSGTTSDTATYTYEWDGDTNASASQRVPVVERLRELFEWTPKQSLWDFLVPLLQEAGLHLFCDEERKWRLVNLNSYSAIGTLTLEAGDDSNTAEASDEIDRDSDLWADAVVCAYTYEDRFGQTVTVYRRAGDADGKTVVFEFDGKPTGDNRPAYLLARLQGRGRLQTITALTQLTAHPSQIVYVYLPGSAPLEGKTERITFDLASGLMEVQTRDLTEI